MPHTTFAYPFEWKIHAWAQRFRGGAGFLALVGEVGEFVRVVEADRVSFGNRCVSHAVKEAETRGAPRWIFYDPFDAPEYAWLEWQGVPQIMWEWLLELPFAPEDLRAFRGEAAALAEVPAAWGVMF